MLKIALGLLLVVTTAAAAAQDSPLVALAKRTNRKAPKKTVITNETVSASKGRLATGSGTTPAATNGETAAPAAAEEVPTSATKIVNERPAQRKVTAAQTAEAPTERGARLVKPESSVRFVEPATVAAQEATGVKPTEPTSSAQNVEPQSSAQNIEPSRAPVNPPQQ